MKWKKLVNAALIVSIALFVVSVFVFYYLENRQLKESLNSVYKGEKIERLELSDMNGQRIGFADASRAKRSLIFIFERPCSPCNKNLGYWNRLSSLGGKDAKTFGVIVDTQETMVNFAMNRKVNFAVGAPVDKNEFVKTFRLHYNFSETILMEGNRVKLVHIGDFDTDSFARFVADMNKTEAKNG